MKTRQLFTVAVIGLMVSVVWAKPPKMKMTTEIPEGIATPDKLETRIGTLTSVDGVPDASTAQKVYDNLDFQLATQAYLNSLQIASLSGIRTAYLKFGPANTTALCWEDNMDSKALWLTPNTVSIYFACWVELGEEPMVLETPPNVMGLIDNAWFNYVADFGAVGPDKGKGGTFIIAPPTYSDEAVAKLKKDRPDAHVYHSATYGHWVLWRGSKVDGSNVPAVNATKKHFKIYPLSQKDSKPTMNFVNMSGKYHNTIHRMDYGLYEEVNEVIQREPTAAGDPEILGQLAAIGIKKGKEFAPDPRMKKILTEAADVAAVTIRTLASRPRGDRWYFFPGKRQWQSPFYGGSHEFLVDGVRMLDARCYFFFYATGITPAMTMKMVGLGSQYAVAYMDADGNPLDGGKTYKVTLPAPIPAKDFWSFTLYDTQTRSMLQTDQRFPGIDGNTPGIQVNADGSVDVYVGPKAPAGKESNWLQSVPGKGWQTLFRLAGPLEPWFHTPWRRVFFFLVE
jgi:hypothetical protein